MQYNPDTMKVKLCKECKGLGFFINKAGERVECGECSGSGRVVVQTITSEYQIHNFEEVG